MVWMGPAMVVRLGFTLTPNKLAFKDFCKEFIIRNPKRGRFFRVQVGLKGEASAIRV